MSNSTAGMRAPVALTMIGTFPPPLHGMAAVNAAVRDRLTAAGAEVQVLDVAAPSLHRGLWSRLGRLPRVLGGLRKLAFMRGLRDRVAYMSLSGGLGQIYEFLFVLLARARGMRIFLHHHSFAYLDRPSRVTSMLMAAAGKDASHITLSQGMAERLQTSYSHVGPVVAISNAVLLLSDHIGELPPAKARLGVLGFLSNIAAEKGVHEFLDVCAAVQEMGLPISAKLAGPFQDAAIEKSVRARLADLPRVTYVGPVYGADKGSFYAGIDVLLFPTRYANEAEPLTVHEAMRDGVPVIAYGRGAIPEILTPACSKVIQVGDDFTSNAVAQIVAWLAEPQSLRAASVAASARFDELRAENVRHWQELKARILGGNCEAIPVGANAPSSSDPAD